jgi:hypothetical protein
MDPKLLLEPLNIEIAVKQQADLHTFLASDIPIDVSMSHPQHKNNV